MNIAKIKSLILAILFLPFGLVAGNDIDLKVAIPHLSKPPQIDNFLTMQPRGRIESQMNKVEGFIQRQPKDGEPSEQRTEVYLGYDDKNLYAVFVAFDSEPEKVRARMNRRENVFSDDIVEIMIDTFHDQRRAYAFVTNPLGVQWDAIWTEGSGFDESFDTLWYSKGKLTDQGYVVLMSIPFKSLRFPSKPEQEWGLIFIREVRRGSFEQSSWPHVSVKIDGRLNQAGTISGLENISPGRNIQVIPYGTFRSFRLLDQQSAQFNSEHGDRDVGADAKVVVNDNLVLDTTFNPDFSQVESDEPQVTVNQRFEVFFPEKRPFFLENDNYFRTPFNLVFTRRIADPQFGARLTGKIGAYAIGALLMDDQAPGRILAEGEAGHGKQAGFGIVRVSRDILNQSNLGFIFTDREFDDSHNRVAGIDGRIKLHQNWTTAFQTVTSTTDPGEESAFGGPAYNIRLDRNGRQFNYHLHYTDIDPDFLTQVGFVTRPDIRNVHQSISYRFRPEGQFLISWGPGLFVARTWDHAGARLDREYNVNLGFSFSGQTNITFFFTDRRDLLRPQDFSKLSKNTDFSTSSRGVFFNTSFLKQLTFSGSLSTGRAINFVPANGAAPQQASRTNANISFSIRPNTTFRVDNTYILSRLSDRVSDERVFTNHILRSRLNWQFNRRLSLRFILQYNANLTNSTLTSLATNKNFNADFLFTYLVNPWTALYVGMNSNYRNINLIGTGDDRQIIQQDGFLNNSRQIFVKYSYLFRF